MNDPRVLALANYTEDVKEGTTAFHEKRPPKFKGR
jgi:1,4-dihydroxy-2-naphthoyl-CoA synthase